MSPFEMERPLRHLLPLDAGRSVGVLVVTLYDLIPLRFPEVYLVDPQAEARYRVRLRLIERADHVLALSRTTATDATALLGVPENRITVIYGGVSEAFRPPDVSSGTAWAAISGIIPQIQDPFVFYTGGLDFRKNLGTTLDAFARLPDRLRNAYQLVITCKARPADLEALLTQAERSGVRGRVVLTGYVPDDVLGKLYQACSAFIFPSLYEGLGLPILEAMRSGAPVLASDRGAMRELVEWDEARFDPADPVDLARRLERVLTDPELSTALREYGQRRSAAFTWREVARKSADCYRSLLSVRQKLF
jgi:glycosyltransferase involved in cell wall biosynthesis